jgi:hypothetical protein
MPVKRFIIFQVTCKFAVTHFNNAGNNRFHTGINLPALTAACTTGAIGYPLKTSTGKAFIRIYTLLKG